MLKKPGQMSRGEELRRLGGPVKPLRKAPPPLAAGSWDQTVPGPEAPGRAGGAAPKLPPGWQLEEGPDRSATIVHPPRPVFNFAAAVILVVALVLWVFGAPAVVDAIHRGQYALAFGLLCVLLIVNSIVGVVLWLRVNLRARWRMGQNFLEVRDNQFEANSFQAYIGAKLMIVGREVAEGGGWCLRVVTPSRVDALYTMQSPKAPCAVGKLIAERTGWALHVPQELEFFSSGPSARATSMDPPPGLGFAVEREPDGVLKLSRKSPEARVGTGMLIGGGIFLGAGLIWAFGDLLVSGKFHGILPLAVFLTIGTGLLLAGLRPAFMREEWRVRRDYLEVREVSPGHTQGVEYISGSLALLKLSGKDSDIWHLKVMARGEQGTLLADITPEEPKLMGEYIAEWTGWTFHVPWELRPPGS